MAAADVVFTTGANHALDLLLGSWTGAAHRGLSARRVRPEPCGDGGQRLRRARRCRSTATAGCDVDERRHGPGRRSARAGAPDRAGQPPRHRPAGRASSPRCAAALGVPLVIDAAQALGHLDCAVGADAIYSSSRKWMAGPRGVGFLADPTRAGRAAAAAAATAGVGPAVHGDAAASNTVRPISLRAWGFRSRSANTWPPDPEQHPRRGWPSSARLTRTALAEVDGWRVVEPVDEPTAITTLAPPDGADPQRVRSVADRRARDRHHLRRGAARAVRDGRPGAAGVAARRQHRRRPGHVRRGAGRRDRPGVTAGHCDIAVKCALPIDKHLGPPKPRTPTRRQPMEVLVMTTDPDGPRSKNHPSSPNAATVRTGSISL